MTDHSRGLSREVFYVIINLPDKQTMQTCELPFEGHFVD